MVPFAELPACATACGPLYDANGGCTPPVKPAQDVSCFCNHSKLAPFKTGTAGVCDTACANAADLSTIQQWFAGFCDKQGQATTTGGSGSSQTGSSGQTAKGEEHGTW